jgi:hypothetical protein
MFLSERVLGAFPLMEIVNVALVTGVGISAVFTDTGAGAAPATAVPTLVVLSITVNVFVVVVAALASLFNERPDGDRVVVLSCMVIVSGIPLLAWLGRMLTWLVSCV